jgi:hypothetical protein
LDCPSENRRRRRKKERKEKKLAFWKLYMFPFSGERRESPTL